MKARIGDVGSTSPDYAQHDMQSVCMCRFGTENCPFEARDSKYVRKVTSQPSIQEGL
jgi:hypothetical protein